MFTLKAISRDSRDHHTFMMSHKKYWDICVDRHSSRMTHSDPVVSMPDKKHVRLKNVSVPYFRLSFCTTLHCLVVQGHTES